MDEELKRFLDKLFKGLGIDPGAEEITEDRAIGLIKERLAEQVKRSKVVPRLDRRYAISTQSGQINEAEDLIMRQLGVSREMFLKYNAEKPSKLSEIQQKINRQVGLSEEQFEKYGPKR